LKPVIFLGPSLSRSEAFKILDAELRPPVKRGDLPSLDQAVDVIGIIDGVFMGEAAVGHREIVDKLNCGVRVYGASSMGALRAAELQEFGMIGIGAIFERYRSGEIEGDDEVALIFNPESLEPLSEPLVNMRLNLQSAVKARSIGESEASMIINCLKSVYFPKRSLSKLKDCAERNLGLDRGRTIGETLEKKYIDYKKEDAIELLTTIAKVVLH
jgi:hypothetical protein